MSNLLIGGTGFVGTALSKALLAAKQPVTALSRDPGALPGVEYVQADLDQAPIDPTVLKSAKNVFILIGQVGPGFDADRELETLRKLATAISTGNQKVFYFSSALVYGQRQTAATEQAKPKPIGPYPQFKLDSEALLSQILPKERLVVLRLANIYGGPGNRGFIGHAVNAVLSPSQPLTINGDGHQKRDYVFIDDLAAAVVAVASAPQATGIVNIATGRSHTLLEVLAALEAASGQKISYQLGGIPPAEAETILLSNQRLKEAFNFTDFVDLTTGLKETLVRYEKGQRA